MMTILLIMIMLITIMTVMIMSINNENKTMAQDNENGLLITTITTINNNKEDGKDECKTIIIQNVNNDDTDRDNNQNNNNNNDLQCHPQLPIHPPVSTPTHLLPRPPVSTPTLWYASGGGSAVTWLWVVGRHLANRKLWQLKPTPTRPATVRSVWRTVLEYRVEEGGSKQVTFL